MIKNSFKKKGSTTSSFVSKNIFITNVSPRRNEMLITHTDHTDKLPLTLYAKIFRRVNSYNNNNMY